MRTPSSRKVIAAAGRADQAHRRLQVEREWMADHGTTVAAYVARYGSKNDPDHYGDGGEAIHAADQAVLNRYQADYDRLQAEYQAAVAHHVAVRDAEVAR